MQRFRSFLGRKRTRAVVAAATALGLASTLVGGDPAQADPKQFAAAIGVGSDTTQDVMNAMSGFANGTNFTPVQSSAATGYRQITSWDATGTTCISPKAPGASILRPNGSTNGRAALSRSIDLQPWGTATSCGGPKNVSGLVHYARSSSGPSGTCQPAPAPCLTHIPFGRDGVSFAYYARGTAAANPVTALSQAELAQIMSTPGPHNIDGVNIYGCSIQQGSGTYSFWLGRFAGVTAAQHAAATAACTPSGQELQENDANALKQRADSTPAFANAQVIIGFSAANFISQTNGVAGSQLPSPAGTVNLGSIEGVGLPYIGPVSGPIAPNPTFYANTTWGRSVYNVLPRSVATGPGNLDLKSLFVGSGSAVCQATDIVEDFGFSPVANCGSTDLQGALHANPN